MAARHISALFLGTVCSQDCLWSWLHLWGRWHPAAFAAEQPFCARRQPSLLDSQHPPAAAELSPCCKLQGTRLCLPEGRGANGTHPLRGGMHVNIQAFARRVACCNGSAWHFLDSYVLVLGRVCASHFCVLWVYHAQAHTYSCSLRFF